MRGAPPRSALTVGVHVVRLRLKSLDENNFNTNLLSQIQHLFVRRRMTHRLLDNAAHNRKYSVFKRTRAWRKGAEPVSTAMQAVA